MTVSQQIEWLEHFEELQKSTPVEPESFDHPYYIELKHLYNGLRLAYSSFCLANDIHNQPDATALKNHLLSLPITTEKLGQ